MRSVWSENVDSSCHGGQEDFVVRLLCVVCGGKCSVLLYGREAASCAQKFLPQASSDLNRVGK